MQEKMLYLLCKVILAQIKHLVFSKIGIKFVFLVYYKENFKMIYVSAPLPSRINVDGIYTVLRVDFSEMGVGIGEAHAFPEISFVSRGCHRGMSNGKETFSEKGHLSIIPPGTFHKSPGPSDSELLIISFESSSPLLSDIYGIPMNLSEKQEKEYREIAEIGLGLFRRREKGGNVGGMVIVDDADKYELEIFKKRLELFLLDLHRCYAKPRSESTSRRDAEFKSIREFLIEHISENLSAEEIADKNSICLSKLKQIFKERGGVKSFFTILKIERSKELIAEGKMNFTEISDYLGFSSLHYYSKTFKKLTGITPSEYERGKGVFY